MSTETRKMKPIWYFVGLMLMWMGALVLVAGIIELVSSSPQRTVLAELHPGIWWGGVMIASGAIFFFKNRK